MLNMFTVFYVGDQKLINNNNYIAFQSDTIINDDTSCITITSLGIVDADWGGSIGCIVGHYLYPKVYGHPYLGIVAIDLDTNSEAVIDDNDVFSTYNDVMINKFYI